MAKKVKTPVQYKMSADDEQVYLLRQEGLLRETGASYRLIDLFCGAGGLTLGFSKFLGQIFLPVWANDFNAYAAKTYSENFGCHCTTDDILDFVETRINEIPKADVVIGGPPCQGFSLLNKQRKEDIRKQLWRPFLRIVEHTGAQVFVMENVPQLIGSTEHAEIIKLSRSMGFQLAWAKLCQDRLRRTPNTSGEHLYSAAKFYGPTHFFPPKKRISNLPKYTTGILFSEEFCIHILLSDAWRTATWMQSRLTGWTRGTEIRNESPPLDLHFGRTPTSAEVSEDIKLFPRRNEPVDLNGSQPELTPECWIRKPRAVRTYSAVYGGIDLHSL